MGKLVIYTCVTGGYDELPEPSVLCVEADYVCFSPDPVNSSVWTWRQLQHVCETNVLTARWHKLHPEVLFPDYDYSLWLDGNVTVASPEFHDTVLDMISRGVKYAGIAHPLRDDVFDEAYAVLSARKEKLFRLLRVCRYLKAQGMPRHAGLQETNVLLRRHCDEDVMRSDAMWWEMMTRFTHRDQLCQSWALLQAGIRPELLIPSGSSARNHPAFRYVVHDKPYLKDRSLRGLCSRKGLRALWDDALCALRKAAFRLLVR